MLMRASVGGSTDPSEYAYQKVWSMTNDMWSYMIENG